MILIPSVDIIDGKTVRLYKGQFDTVTTYNILPNDLVKSYMDMGYSFIHVVNLDRANGTMNPTTERMIEQICSLSGVRIQMGGGLRDAEAVEQANQLGVNRFVLGTLVVHNHSVTRNLITHYGKDRFTFALDVQKKEGDFIVKTHGWKHNSTFTLTQLLTEYQHEITHLLCTDIDKDGALSSPNFSLYEKLKSQYPQFFIQASGGIHHEKDLYTLSNLNIDGVVVGRAIHESKIDLKALSHFS